jgi:hypothetical protein
MQRLFIALIKILIEPSNHCSRDLFTFAPSANGRRIDVHFRRQCLSISARFAMFNQSFSCGCFGHRVHFNSLFAPRKPKIMTLEALKNQQKRRIMKKDIARSKKNILF